jgi:hypothetical protein
VDIHPIGNETVTSILGSGTGRQLRWKCRFRSERRNIGEGRSVVFSSQRTLTNPRFDTHGNINTRIKFDAGQYGETDIDFECQLQEYYSRYPNPTDWNNVLDSEITTGNIIKLFNATNIESIPDLCLKALNVNFETSPDDNDVLQNIEI